MKNPLRLLGALGILGILMSACETPTEAPVGSDVNLRPAFALATTTNPFVCTDQAYVIQGNGGNPAPPFPSGPG